MVADMAGNERRGRRGAGWCVMRWWTPAKESGEGVRRAWRFGRCLRRRHAVTPAINFMVTLRRLYVLEFWVTFRAKPDVRKDACYLHCIV